MTENTSLADRLTSSETGQEASLWLPLLNLLAQGDPVEFSALAAATGRTEADVREALAAVPDIEYEYGRIIGQGLTLRPTPHRFEVNGEQLYTWCALDTLIFPTLLGTSARVESVSPASGNPINVTVGPDGVQSVSPETAVVSLVNPDDMTSLRPRSATRCTTSPPQKRRTRGSRRIPEGKSCRSLTRTPSGRAWRGR